MARGVRLSAGARAWLALAAALAVGAALAASMPTGALDWQPALAAREPWRAWSAAFVHHSRLHLGANLAGAVLVAALGVAARVPPRTALAWAAAWPATQLGLLAAPQLLHYGGASGVLHAGVAAVVVHLLVVGGARERAIAAALGLGLVAKLVDEAAWVGAPRPAPGWDIAIAPFAHLSGSLAGLVASGTAEACARGRSP